VFTLMLRRILRLYIGLGHMWGHGIYTFGASDVSWYRGRCAETSRLGKVEDGRGSLGPMTSAPSLGLTGEDPFEICLSGTPV